MTKQCPFCLLVNVLDSGDADPLCLNCGLSLGRSHSRHDAGHTDPLTLAASGQPAAEALPEHWTVAHGPAPTPARAPAEGLGQLAERLGFVLEFEDATVVVLESDDIILGRRPSSRAGVATLALNDASRTISKEHARVRRTGDTWTLEDLGSSNGTTVVQHGVEVRLTPGVASPVAEYLKLGEVRARIRRRVATDVVAT